MARRDEGAVIRITTYGLRKYERLIRLDREDIAREIQDGMMEIGYAAVGVLQTAAPERTGRLKEGIKITGRNRSVTRPNVRVGVDATSDEGFNYVPVTRFGRKAVEAKRRARPARTYSAAGRTGRGYQKRPFRAAMLRFEPGPPGSGFIYRRRVKAYRPPGGDWVRAASGRIERMASRYVEDEITETIERTFNRHHLAGGRLGGPRRTTVKVLR